MKLNRMVYLIVTQFSHYFEKRLHFNFPLQSLSKPALVLYNLLRLTINLNYIPLSLSLAFFLTDFINKKTPYSINLTLSLRVNR